MIKEEYSDNMRRYHGRQARGELRGSMFFPLISCALAVVYMTVHGIRHFDQLEGLISLLGAVTLGALGVGICRCQAWTRWPTVIALGLVAASSIYNKITQGHPLSNDGFLFGVLAIFLATPGGADLYEWAAESPEKQEHREAA